MRFHLTEEQSAIQDAVRGTLADVWPMERLHKFADSQIDDGTDCDPESWQALMALGIGALALPEADGGAGLGLLDAALVCEVVGEAAGPGPVIGQSLAAIAVARSADLVGRMAPMMLDSARQALGDPVAGLHRFLTSEAELLGLCERAFWLLDGWEIICRLWHAAPALMPRHAALQDMARSLPALPDEAEAWLGLPNGTAEQLDRSHSLRPARVRTTAADQMALLEKLRLVQV